MYRFKCRKCSGKKFWKVRRGKLRCQNCLYEFRPKLGGINLTKYQWKVLLKWFLRCQSANVICEETGLSKYRVLKALNLVRLGMARDIPEIFEGVVEIDETYLGGQKRNKRKFMVKNQKEVLGPLSSLFSESWPEMGKFMLNWSTTLKPKI